VSETGERDLARWSFPAGSVGHSDSVKGYDVECTDGPVGTVSWADYKPGESYLVVTCSRHLRHTNHLVPAGAVARVDHAARTVRLTVSADQVRNTPEHDDPEAPPDWGMVDRFERGMLAGGFVWPYTDV
jgi:hypothetical protein